MTVMILHASFGVSQRTISPKKGLMHQLVLSLALEHRYLSPMLLISIFVNPINYLFLLTATTECLYLLTLHSYLCEKRDRADRQTRQAHDLKTGGSIPSPAIKYLLRYLRGRDGGENAGDVSSILTRGMKMIKIEYCRQQGPDCVVSRDGVRIVIKDCNVNKLGNTLWNRLGPKYINREMYALGFIPES